MPRRKSGFPTSKPRSGDRIEFRQRYAQIEAQRDALMQRLRTLGEPARKHQSYKRIVTLLNTTFRKVPLAQRVAVLQAASWMIDLLERITFFV